MLNTSKLFLGLVVIALFMVCALPAVGQKKKAAKTNLAACLPADVKLDEVVVYDGNGAKLRTVLDELKKIKARCAKGKLIAPDKREIRFFRPSCWGNPPLDAQEILAAEASQMQTLKQRYHVIIFQCNPMIQ